MDAGGAAFAGASRSTGSCGSTFPARRAGNGDDLFSALCQAESDDGQRFSDDDVINHVIFLLTAAHDTSTITISTMMSCLGQHPDWQQRCREDRMYSTSIRITTSWGSWSHWISWRRRSCGW